MLTDSDRRVLDGLGLAWSVAAEGGWLSLIVCSWPLPAGLDRDAADLLIRIPPGYPDMPLDMWYFSPAVARGDGRDIEQTQVREHFSDKEWQRWSRHLNAGGWKPGTDGIESYLARLRRDVLQAAAQVPA